MTATPRDFRGPWTAGELAALPDEGLRHELVAGRLLAEPPASFRHGEVAARIFRSLDRHVRRRALGRVVSAETGFLLARDPDTVRAPDVAFVSRASLARAGTFSGYFPGPPDLAVEVLSPADRPADAHAKAADYLAAGCAAVWIVDPRAREVRVHRTLLRPATFAAAETLDAGDPLPGLRIAVARLFPDDVP